MRKDSIQTRKRRCAKKQRSGRNHLQQQQHQRHGPRLDSSDSQAHSGIIKRQYPAVSNSYAYFPSLAVKTKTSTVPGALPHDKVVTFSSNADAYIFDNYILPLVDQVSEHKIELKGRENSLRLSLKVTHNRFYRLFTGKAMATA
ncbi:hypothetical protein TSMEX_000288 [Taenia solium]|eukprot:TsM_000822900 transcript=TsM_000822900 gene=TsM_000822900